MVGPMETIGQYVLRIRRDANMSAAAVARALGVSSAYVCDLEADRRALSPTRWHAFVAAFPGATVRGLALASLATGPVTIDVSESPPERLHAAADALASAVAA